MLQIKIFLGVLMALFAADDFIKAQYTFALLDAATSIFWLLWANDQYKKENKNESGTDEKSS